MDVLLYIVMIALGSVKSDRRAARLRDKLEN